MTSIFLKKEITDIFIRPRITTLLSKIREFQYKLLHGAIYTNEQLFKFGFVNTDYCSFCKRELESYEHIFWDCKDVKLLWQKVIEKFSLVKLQNAKWKDIHVGVTGKDLEIKICNTVIFLIKFIIFRSRSKGVVPTQEEIFQRIADYRNEEKAIAIKRNKLDKHLLKWERLYKNGRTEGGNREQE